MPADELTFDEYVAIAREGYAAFNRGEIHVVVDMLSPDVSWSRRRAHPLQGTHRGRSDVAENVLRTFRDQFTEIEFDPVEFLDYEEHIVVRLHQHGRGRGRASGVEVEGGLVHVMRVTGEGLSELRAFATLDEALAAIGAGQESKEPPEGGSFVK